MGGSGVQEKTGDTNMEGSNRGGGGGGWTGADESNLERVNNFL